MLDYKKPNILLSIFYQQKLKHTAEMTKKLLLAVLTMLGLVAHTYAQDKTVTGTVTDAKDGAALPGVTVRYAKGGAVTDGTGHFSIKVPSAISKLIFSSVGYTTQEVAIPASGTVNVALAASVSQLDEVVVSVGSRSSQRTVTDSPLPINIFSTADLKSTGQVSFDKALQYRVPSFNTVNTPVNDASTLLDPYELRNLGPSRTLILVNGKRKNLSSLLYVQFAPGRGETGVDLSSIPTDAIKRVEVLSDGASAQYGSDAIAGVMNVILKDKFEYSSLTVNSGITGKGDGASYGLAFNGGANFAEKGFVNYTVGFSQQDNAIRSGNVDLVSEQFAFGGDPTTDAQIAAYLKRFPTGNNKNGTGATTAAKFLINAGVPVSPTAQLYANAAFVAKKVLSNANYRQPYWKQDYGLLHAAGTEYIGYEPTFEGDLTDYNATIGVKDDADGWKKDISFTIGGNQQLYSVDNTVNHSLKGKSPISFKTGGYNFSHMVGNIDLSKQVTEKLNVAFGSEMRSETYQIIAGDTSSYSGEGSNSFPGIRAENAKTNTRFNFGAYLDLSYDITDKWLVNGTVRGENYSDFGGTFVWKASTRYKILDDKIVLRGSASTGFRAPTLHQIYAQSTQAAFVGGQIALSGLFNNKSVVARALGIPSLKPEKSTNFTLGLGLQPAKNLSITLDYYNIDISDRIVYSSSIKTSDASSVLGQILTSNNLKTVQFFINGIKTNTQGLDYVVSYKNVLVGKGKMNFNLAGNFTLNNEIVGDPTTPAAIKAAGSSILSTQIKSLLTKSRPQYKAIFGVDYMIGKLQLNLNNTLFGKTEFQDLDNSYFFFDSKGVANTSGGTNAMEYIKQEFSPAVVTDLNIGYNFTKKLSASFTINNLLNVLPSWKLVALNSTGQKLLDNPAQKSLLEGGLTFDGRYQILGYNGSQFSQLGTTFNASINYKF